MSEKEHITTPKEFGELVLKLLNMEGCEEYFGAGIASAFPLKIRVAMLEARLTRLEAKEKGK